MLETAKRSITAAHTQRTLTQVCPQGNHARHSKKLVPDLVVDKDQQYKITLKIEDKANRTAKGYKLICLIFRLDKTSPHLELEKLSENRINGYSI